MFANFSPKKLREDGMYQPLAALLILMTFDEGIPIFNLHEIHSGFAGVLAGHKKDKCWENLPPADQTNTARYLDTQP